MFNSSQNCFGSKTEFQHSKFAYLFYFHSGLLTFNFIFHHLSVPQSAHDGLAVEYDSNGHIVLVGMWMRNLGTNQIHILSFQSKSTAAVKLSSRSTRPWTFRLIRHTYKVLGLQTLRTYRKRPGSNGGGSGDYGSPSEGGGSLPTWVIVLMVAFFIIPLCCFIGFCCFPCGRNSKNSDKQNDGGVSPASASGDQQYGFEGGFQQGQGGYGYVDPNGQQQVPVAGMTGPFPPPPPPPYSTGPPPPLPY